MARPLLYGPDGRLLAIRGAGFLRSDRMPTGDDSGGDVHAVSSQAVPLVDEDAELPEEL